MSSNVDNNHPVEEDWSSFMSESMTGFAQHETQTVRVSSSQTQTILSVGQLSPLDMMNLSHGHHDATGHRIWLGAYFFMEALDKDELLGKSLFRSKRVLELGSGSGVSGLTVLSDSLSAPTSIVFTDSDPASLELCRRNCQQNLPSDDGRYSISLLEWGNSLHGNDANNNKFDTVFATDVLYDTSSLKPLLCTVRASLKPGGFFLMAHVPRASLPGEAMVGAAEKLESFITTETRSYSLELDRIIRPRDLCNDAYEESLNSISLQEMQDAGAAILVFQARR